MQYKIPAGAARILEILETAGHEAYLVGGCVRDLLRGAEPHDLDICTSAKPEETKTCFATSKLIETGIKHGTLTVIENGESCEITTYRTDLGYSDRRRPDAVVFVTNLYEDLRRRDFTINAIAMDRRGTLRDPFDGRGDILRKRIRCVGEPDLRLQEDGLRVMRGLRFAATLSYDIEPETAAALHRNRGMLKYVAAERVQEELCKLLTGAGAAKILREYPDIPLEFWPELGPLMELEQRNPWHCWGGWEHTLHTVEAVPPDLILRLTMLLHDIGKPSCKRTGEDGIDRFHGHQATGAELADGMLRALRFDNRTRQEVTSLIALNDDQLTAGESDIRRRLNRIGPERFFRLLEVKRADKLGQNPEKAGPVLAELPLIRAKAETILAERQCLTLRDLAVNGRDVLAAGITPGREVGRILNGLLEQVLNGETPNERGALLKRLKNVAERIN